MGIKGKKDVWIKIQMESVIVNLAQGSLNSVRILNSALEKKV